MLTYLAKLEASKAKDKTAATYFDPVFANKMVTKLEKQYVSYDVKFD